jgi:hypothetical protein
VLKLGRREGDSMTLSSKEESMIIRFVYLTMLSVFRIMLMSR